jgi:hypothetical protein
MSILPGKNGRDARNEALPETLNGGTEQEPGELSLSGIHTQSLVYLNAAGQFGAKVVQFAVKPVIDYDVRNPVISKKVLAAMAGDPDPTTTLADIRKLLVGPTHKLHDAMFEEVITILEESDREVQDSLQSLESNYIKLSHVTDELVSASLESKDQNRIQTELLQKEMLEQAVAQQDLVSEMFLAIDAKIEELAAQVTQKVEDLSKKIEADLREAAENQERNMWKLEARLLASSREAADVLENRVATLENSAGSVQDNLREVFADGLASMADRVKALHQG